MIDKSGLDLITEERVKQIVKNGYTAFHDLKYSNKELLLAALAYLYATIFDDDSSGLAYWPFDREDWHNEGYVENLKKVGALIAAELDRIQIN